MVLLSVDEADGRQLKVTFTEPFLRAHELKFRDAHLGPLTFRCAQRGNRLTFSGADWLKYQQRYGIRGGDKISIEGIANKQCETFEEEAIQEETEVVIGFYHCSLVGRCLTDSVVHFPSLRNTTADLWHPIGGIYITDLGEKMYLFQFFHEVDLKRVLDGTPWFFNNHLLFLQRIPIGGNPLTMQLNQTDFWVQVHELPPGLMNENMAKQFGNFCGKFIDYDVSNLSSGFRNFMRIRVCLDILAPLKRKKKVHVGSSMVVYAKFKAEPRRWRMVESRWLREADGSKRAGVNLETLNQTGAINGIPENNWRKDDSRIVGADFGPMELGLDEENTPVEILKGKKRQRCVENPSGAMGPRNMELARIKCGYENGIDIGATGTRGGLSLGWKGNSLVNLKSFSSSHIDVEIQDCDCEVPWRLTRFYGNPTEQERMGSWHLLRQLSGDLNTPWVVLGDFNEITSSFEKTGAPSF
ncbi:nucleolin-like [Gossypium australe]|uniref:Nucleolin-like n=1 Tax=Gossypium australe TaxID=47621 RepID=A0A5B6WLW5_9ROSI|nr:nucleolin-like [Gossypium australe]